MVWNLSLGHCHVESTIEVCPGMTLSLFLVLPGMPQAIVVEEALVTWAREGECGIQFQRMQPSDASHLQQFLMPHS